MIEPHNPFLLVAAAASALAALLHLGCIAAGARGYRVLGAGERMARMAANGHWSPALVTLVISAVLSVCSLYALSGAGLIGRLPLLRPVLCAITAVYLLRGVAFAPLMSRLPENSAWFWFWSSSIALAIGAVHLLGLWQAWPQL